MNELTIKWRIFTGGGWVDRNNVLQGELLVVVRPAYLSLNVLHEYDLWFDCTQPRASLTQ